MNSIEQDDNGDLVPAWLNSMLRLKYFSVCEFHGKSECNMFCLDCMGNAFCSYCLENHRGHEVVQIRRSSYHDAVRVDDIHKYLDLFWVQTYIINSAKIVFLNERPQPKLPKAAVNACQTCGRSICFNFRFCSIGCKLGAMKNGDRELRFSLPQRDNQTHHGTQMNLKKNKCQISISNSASDIHNESTSSVVNCGNNISTAIINKRDSTRRKGIVHCFPFE
ncbi:hypothetical protein ACHQM5_002771 [Ranunculus cassubicifolius]